MDLTLAKTIEGLSNYIKEFPPDLIIVHGDRAEALAGAIVGALNNILVAHIEGGEVSGTIDELIRHSVSKMSHVHFVANEQAKKRLIQMGEIADAVFTIGSPDVDIMFSNNLPKLEYVKEYYNIRFEKYAVVMFHPVTTEVERMEQYAIQFSEALLETGHNYVVIFPNNDLGSESILKAYQKFNGHKEFQVFPSLRFEYFLVLLKNATYIIGNSSAGIREAPYYHLPSVNIGTRQQNRAISEDILHCGYNKEEIVAAVRKIKTEVRSAPVDGSHYGNGNSNRQFLDIISQSSFWDIPKQKVFADLD